MNDSLNSPITQGAHHVGLTVPNIDSTRKFFVDTLKYRQVGEIPDYPAVFLSDDTTMITLWQVSDPQSAAPFDRKNVVGLHHLALKVSDFATLNRVHQVLSAAADVEIEFEPELLGGGPAQHMMCAIPGGIRVEFIAVEA